MSEFKKLYDINVDDKLDTRTGNKGLTLSYLQWALAWKLFKEQYPEGDWRPVRFGDLQKPFQHYEDTGSFVAVQVSYDGDIWKEPEIMPILNYKNQPIIDPPASDNVNSAIRRCLVKALAKEGLGLNVFEGDIDLPSGKSARKKSKPKKSSGTKDYTSKKRSKKKTKKKKTSSKKSTKTSKKKKKKKKKTTKTKKKSTNKAPFDADNDSDIDMEDPVVVGLMECSKAKEVPKKLIELRDDYADELDLNPQEFMKKYMPVANSIKKEL